MPSLIQFGTDGWRAVIADEFTFDNVRKVAQAACDALKKTSRSRLILVGYDRRFFSERFAVAAAQVAVANGFHVEISTGPISSPMLSFQTKARKAAVGFMITASHNPFQFNGFKLKGPHGGSVDETVTKLVEDQLDGIVVHRGDDSGKRTDFFPAYAASIKKLVSPAVLRKLKHPVVLDAMHGPGGEIAERIIGKSSALITIRGEHDPMFGGGAPEPIEKYLAPLKEAVLKRRASIGIAVDGDVDRIGIVDDKGRYLPPHTVMPLILLHLIENRKLKGKVIQTVSMGYLPRKIAEHFKLEFEEVEVGFKHIAKRMGISKVLFGGEESGGYGVGLWSPERDGILCGLLLIEMIAKTKKPLSALVDDLQARFGVSRFKRVDFHLNGPVDKKTWTEFIQSHITPAIGTLMVKSVNALDGIKIVTADDSWVLMRPSGTEPLIRTYSEGTSDAVVETLLAEASRLVHLRPAGSSKNADGSKKVKRRKAAVKK